jgi:opine dehydrogenase
LIEESSLPAVGSAAVRRYRVGIAGAGAIALASAAWLCRAGHGAMLWSPGGTGTEVLRVDSLHTEGLHQGTVTVQVANNAAQLCRESDVLLVAVPANGHRRVMDALLPWLRDGQVVIVSSMASLSALYLFENALRAKRRRLTVVSFNTTVLTARRESLGHVRIMMRRSSVSVSALPQTQTTEAVALCAALFGGGFSAQENALASALSNVNPGAHVPLALFNWTRIERAEAWPQYHYLTPSVARVIEKLDAERRALAHAFGIEVGSVETHFARSFGTASVRLQDIADELHAERGGPPGPTSLDTRFLSEDLPYGLVFLEALGRLAGVPMPATRTMVESASLVAGRDFAQDNDLLAPLGLETETVEGLRNRLR